METKDKSESLFWATFAIVVLSGAFAHIKVEEEKAKAPESKDSVYIEVVDSIPRDCSCEYEEEDKEWNKFIKALIIIESGGKHDAVGTKDDVGVLQITPILVDDANRIIGYDKYTYEDRYDSVMSVEMFNVIQSYYNPTRDIHLALKIWNSKAPLSYHRKVMDKFNEIKNEAL